MTRSQFFTSSDWDNIRLVAFDVDGTLYRQRPLRLRMARDILLYTLLNLDVNVIRVLAMHRRIREQLGDKEVVDLERVLIAETAKATTNSTARVRAILSEWVEQRPLSYLPGCLYPGLPQLFAGLRRKGKLIGILSDYPAEAKLIALGLTADHVVSAGDEGVGLPKPHPRGLESLIAAAKVEAHTTVLIGDRADRDGLAARRAGAWALIKSSKTIDGWQTFNRFDDALFEPFF